MSDELKFNPADERTVTPESSDTGIDRRSFLAQLSLAMGALAMGVTEQKAEAASPNFTYNLTAPNILIVMLDQLRYAELKQNLPGVSTVLPNITTLQAQSIEFTNFFVAGTTCTPSRAAFMTGLYPTQTRMYITQGDGATPSLQTGFPTFAGYLESIGYQTAYYGKWHLSNESADDNDLPTFAPYGFTVTGIETPSPDGWANEGSTGGTFVNPPHQGKSGNWINDQQIVNNFALGLSSAQLAGQVPTPSQPYQPWCAVVSLINPHDMSNYPLYLLNYCEVTAGDVPITPYYPPQRPDAAPTWAIDPNTYPNLPANPDLPTLQPLFTYQGQGTPLICPTARFANYGTGVTSNAQPSNITDPLTQPPKPQLQVGYEQSLSGVLGPINTPQPSPPGTGLVNGDWGHCLNIYYWLASCADQLIGNLATPDPHLIGSTDPTTTYCTILGQFAALLASGSPLSSAQKGNLTNTVIVFTTDHGELGGAHGMLGKSACSYDEAINVPLFVHVPGLQTNLQRNQLVSSVDFFGLIAGLAQPTYNAHQVPTWQAANSQLTTRVDMLQCLQSNSYVPQARQITIGGNSTPYVLHTYNEWFSYKNNRMQWASTDPNHLVCVRTPSQKLVYYDTWNTSQPTPTESQFHPVDFSPTGNPNFATQWTTDNAEYYDLSSNPTETGNGFTATPSAGSLADLESAFSGCVSGELQLALPTALQNVQTAAANAFLSFITEPSNIVIQNASGINTNTTTIYFTGTNVLPGPNAIVIGPIGSQSQKSQTILLDDTETSPYAVSSIAFSGAGTYSLTVANPSGLSSSPVNFSVTQA